MGQHSWVLVHHDMLHHIEKDKDFGLHLSRAITANRRNSSNIPVHAGGSGPTVASVIGGYFSSHSIQIAVAEGNTGWLANYQGKPDYSLLNKTEAIRMLFGRKKEKVPKES